MSTRRQAKGFTLVEVMMGLTFLAVAVLGLFSAMHSTGRFTQVSRERSVAMNAARGALDQVMEVGLETFDRVIPSYNADPNDDPDGPGTAPGPNFAVFGLSPQAGDPDGSQGQITIDATNPDLLDVRATVAFRGEYGPMNVALRTRLARTTQPPE